jgi:hypothetical protein
MIGFFNEKGIHPIIAASVLTLLIASVPIAFVDETYIPTNNSTSFDGKTKSE